MKNHRTILKIAMGLVALLLAGPAFALSDKPIPVVATFSILGDMVKRIGGAHVSVSTLVGPDGDAHVFQPTPADARAVSKARLLFVNGLNFEGWIDRLVEASGFIGMRVVTTRGINAIAFEDGHDEDHKDDHGKEARHKDEHGHEKKHAGADRHKDHADDKHGDEHAGHDHGAFDPHAWQNLENAVTYVDNITAALAKVDPARAAAFYGNRAAYVAEIKSLDTDIRAMMVKLPKNKRTVVTSHDAFGYFAGSYGLAFKAPQGLSTDSEPSAADVAKMILQIRKEGISAVFVETITDNRLLEQIARETGATIGGMLYSDALSGSDGPASTYLDMIRHNATTLTQSLGS
jgi:zinc/manganese transport system substrate-binding protein